MAALLKFGKSALSSTTSLTTAPPLPERTQETLATRREAGDRVNAALRSYHKTLGKKRDVRGEKSSALPLQIIGQEMIAAGSVVGEQGEQLKHFGSAQLELASLTTAFLDSLDTQLLSFEAKGIEHSDFARTLKETEKRRDTFESALTKARKSSKKEEGEELITARVAYEDYCMTLERKADSLLTGVEKEQRDLEALLDLQVEFATEYAKILIDAKQNFPSSSRHSLMPPTTTRMSRSHSDSALQPEFGQVPRARPGERRSTVTLTSRGEQIKSVEEKVKGRSRSGSLLARFVTKKDETEDTSSAPSNFSLPSLPTLNSLKKLASTSNVGGSSKYNSLAESSLPPSSSYSSPSTIPRYTRSQTSPTFRADPPLSKPSTPISKSTTPKPTSIIGSSFIAKFAFKATESGELELERGDIVRVEKVVNEDWWRGSIINSGKEGMFPSGFVVPHDELSNRTEQEDLLMRKGSVNSAGRQSFDSDWGGGGGMSSSNSITDHSGADDDESEEESNGLRPNNSSLDSTAQNKSHLVPSVAIAKRAPPPPPPRKYTASPFANQE